MVRGYYIRTFGRIAAALHVRLLVIMGKVRLYIRVRKQGGRIESVPLKRLVKLSGFRKRRWEFKDGWLILEGF